MAATDVAVFSEGSIRHTAVIPIAGDQITNDIAMALRTPTSEAEEIKLRFGVAKQVLADPADTLEVPVLVIVARVLCHVKPWPQ